MCSSTLLRILPGFVLAAALSAAPLISPGGIVNSASFAPPLSPGGAIAQGSIFSIFGSALGPATPATQPVFPLDPTLGSVSISVTQGKTTVAAIPLYVSPTLINALMPSNTPLGKVAVQVTFNGVQSNNAPVLIAANAPGIYTATGLGIGPGVVQNAVSATAVPINASSATATPGQTEILYLTGLGAIQASDNTAPPVGNLSYQTEVWVGGVPVTSIAYSGRSPCCSGLDEIVFALPQNVPTGCFVPVIVRVAGVAVSNTVTIAIDPKGAPCSDANNPFTSALTQGGTVGAVALVREQRHSDSGSITDLTTDVAVGTFQQPTGPGFIFNSVVAQPAPGSCAVYTAAGNFGTGVAPASFPAFVLDAGSISLATPAGNQPFAKGALQGQTFYSTVQGGSSPSVTPPPGTPALFLNPGKFTVAGAGGQDVGAFNASVTVPAQSFTWSNRSQITTVNRTQPLTFSWSGANGTVLVGGLAYDAPNNFSTQFACVAPSGATSFTVPPWILANLPPSRTPGGNSFATVGLADVSGVTPFTATGLSSGATFAASAFEKVVTIQ